MTLGTSGLCTKPSLPDKVDVLIAGSGPAGLCLAAQLSQFPEIETMIVERMPSNIIKCKADGINTRTMEMFQAFGFADKVKRETYWVNQTAFWMPDQSGQRWLSAGQFTLVMTPTD